jgi:hypothetical protein
VLEDCHIFGVLLSELYRTFPPGISGTDNPTPSSRFKSQLGPQRNVFLPKSAPGVKLIEVSAQVSKGLSSSLKAFAQHLASNARAVQ